MKAIYIADFFYPETLGGAEQSDFEFLNILKSEGFDLVKIRSIDLSEKDVEKHKNELWFISNFIGLKRPVRDSITEKVKNYVIIEHDHKYLARRDPSPYPNYIAPKEELVNIEFYQAAKYIMVQSNLHQDIIHKNLDNITTYTVGGNLWTDELLEKLRELPSPPENNVFSIMVSNIEHKNTRGAVHFCQMKNLKYELISPCAPEQFFELISKNEYFLFLPQCVETLSRIVVEAKMLGIKVMTNNKIGAASESWFKDLRGDDLINYMKYDKKKEIRDFIKQLC